MTGNETMYWLAENYWIGIGVATGIVVLLYVGISLLVFFNARKMGVNVAIGAMIPVWHFKYIIQGIVINHEPKPKAPKVKKAKPVKKPEDVGGTLE